MALPIHLELLERYGFEGLGEGTYNFGILGRPVRASRLRFLQFGGFLVLPFLEIEIPLIDDVASDLLDCSRSLYGEGFLVVCHCVVTVVDALVVQMLG